MLEFAYLILISVPLFFIPSVVGSALLPPPVHWASRWWLGFVVTGLFLLVGHGLSVPQVTVFSVLAIGLCFCLWQIRSRPDLFLLNARGLSWHAILSFVLLCGVGFSVYTFILTHPLQPGYWDAIRIWFNKAKALFYWIPFGQLPYPGFKMMNYPHLGPVYEMFVMKFTGAPIEPIGRLIYPTFYFMWIFASYQFFRALFNPILMWIIPFVGLVFFNFIMFTNGYQDGFLSVMAGMGCLHLLKFLGQDKSISLPRTLFAWHPDLFLGILFTAVLSFIKVEGTVWALIIILSFLVTFGVFEGGATLFRHSRFFLPYFALFSLILGIWPFLLFINGVDMSALSGDAFTYRDILLFYRHFDRLPTIFAYFINYWKLYWPILLSSVLLSVSASLCSSQYHKILFFLWFAIITHTAVLFLIFLATLVPLVWHLDTAFARLAFQEFALFAWIIFVGLLATGKYLLDRSRITRRPGIPIRDIASWIPISLRDQFYAKIGEMKIWLRHVRLKLSRLEVWNWIRRIPWTVVCWAIALALPLVWLWPRFANPTFMLVDDAHDLRTFFRMHSDFWGWLKEDGWHGEVENGRYRPIYWLLRYFLYFLPAGLNPAGWIFIHYLNLVLTLTASFFLIKRITHRNMLALLGIALFVLNLNAIHNFTRLATQEVWQVLGLSWLFFIGSFYFETPSGNRWQRFLLAGASLAILFLLYFVKETSVVLFPFSLVMLVASLWLRQSQKTWLIFAVLNLALFALQRFLSPPLTGYAGHYQLSLELIARNFQRYFFELQWHFVFFAALISYLVRLFYLDISLLRQSRLEKWQFAFLVLGAGFFMIYLPWGEHVRRYLLVADVLLIGFSTLELAHYWLCRSRVSILMIALFAYLAYSSSHIVAAVTWNIQTQPKGKGPVRALEWFAAKAKPDATVLVLEYEYEIIGATVIYLQDFFHRKDIKVMTLSDFATRYKEEGYNIEKIEKMTPEILDQVDYIFWNHRGIARAEMDSFHQQFFSEFRKSRFYAKAENIYRDIPQQRTPFPEGTEIWELKQ